MSHLRNIALILTLVLVVSVPNAANAQTNSSLQARIQALMAQLTQLQAQLVQVSAGDSASSGGALSTTPVAPSTTFTVTPTSGLAPLTVSARVKVDMGTITCGATYLGDIDWDDNRDSSDKVVAENTGCSRIKEDTITFAYTYADTFSVSFEDAEGESYYHDIVVTDDMSPLVEAVSTSASVTTPGDNVSSSYGTYTIKYDVTAIDSDTYIPATAATSGRVGAEYAVTGSPFSGSATGVLTSTANLRSGYFLVEEGETETFALTVIVDPDTTGRYRVGLSSIGYATSAKVPDQEINMDGKRDGKSRGNFRTKLLTIPSELETVKPTLSFSASPSKITSGSASTLSWSTTNATRCYLMSSAKEYYIDVRGSMSVTPTRTTTYRLICLNNAQTDKDDAPSAEKSVTVTVAGLTAPTGSIDDSSLYAYSGNPTISGTAKDAGTVGISIGNGDKVYGSGDLTVRDGRWSVTVSPALAPGKYTVSLSTYDHVNQRSYTLDEGSLIIEDTTEPLVSPTPTNTKGVSPETLGASAVVGADAALSALAAQLKVLVEKWRALKP